MESGLLAHGFYLREEMLVRWLIKKIKKGKSCMQLIKEAGICGLRYIIPYDILHSTKNS